MKNVTIFLVGIFLGIGIQRVAGEQVDLMINKFSAAASAFVETDSTE